MKINIDTVTDRFPLDLLLRLNAKDLLSRKFTFLEKIKSHGCAICRLCGEEAKTVLVCREYHKDKPTFILHLVGIDENELTIHHIHYKSLGGSEDLQNKEWVCQKCHETLHNNEFIDMGYGATLSFNKNAIIKIKGI